MTVALAHPGPLAKLRIAAADIKLAHSVFALPFALLGAFMARPAGAAWGRFGSILLLVVLCMVFARTWAMLINRIADRRFDAENPRTTGRALASGRLSPGEARLAAWGSAAAFAACTSLFGVLLGNWWPALLSAPVLAWLALYSYTKRFTAAAHLVLGTALAASPLAAAIAVEPAAAGLSSGEAGAALNPALWLLAGMVALWVAGFDVIYALQDIDFDRSRGLHSIPARLGWRSAAWASRALHAGAAACLVLAWRAEPRFGWIMGAGVLLVLGLLVLEHAVLARRGRAGLDTAFFTINGVVSCVLGAAGCVDLLL